MLGSYRLMHTLNKVKKQISEYLALQSCWLGWTDAETKLIDTILACWGHCKPEIELCFISCSWSQGKPVSSRQSKAKNKDIHSKVCIKLLIYVMVIKQARKKITIFRSLRTNRLLPSIFESHYESEASCIAFIMKISFH